MNFLTTNISVQHCRASRSAKSHPENRFREDSRHTDLAAFQQPLARISLGLNTTTYARTSPADTPNSRNRSPACVGMYALFIASMSASFFSCALADQENSPDYLPRSSTEQREEQPHGATSNENVLRLQGEGTVEFHETLPNGDVYDVVIAMDVLEKTCMMLTIFVEPKIWGVWSKEEIRHTRNYIRRFSVRYNGREAPIPFSAYSDLAQIRKIKFNARSDGFTLYMSLGDAGSSSRASFEFNRSGFLIKRRSSHSFIPEDGWEETKYFPPE